VCIMLLYIAYLMVTVPQLVRRTRDAMSSDGLDENGRSLFSLGRWGLAVNLVAVLYGALMVVNLAWPRAAVYDPAGKGWYLQYSAEIVLALVLVTGVFTFRLLRKNYFASIGHFPAAVASPVDTAAPAAELG
jgi:hypothetical protein